MEIENYTPDNTAIILVDYVTGFANLIGSQSIHENINGGVALAKMALAYKIPLVVTLGPKVDPRGPIYPQIAEVLGDHAVVHRGGSFDAFAFPAFRKAVEDTGMKRLIIAGLMTEGCILNTTLSALRLGYEVSIVVDATAGASELSHKTAMTRLMQLGVTPLTWLSLASEFQVSYENLDTLADYLDIQSQDEGFAMNMATIRAAQAIGAMSADPNKKKG